nr:uncharacterized protein LOC113801918 isoform X1 [Penaeus vannamei]
MRRWGAVSPLSLVHTLYCEFSATTHHPHASASKTLQGLHYKQNCSNQHPNTVFFNHRNNTPSRCQKGTGKTASPKCCVRAGSPVPRTPSCAATARGCSAKATTSSSTNARTKTTPSATMTFSGSAPACRCMECHEALITR